MFIYKIYKFIDKLETYNAKYVVFITLTIQD